MTYKLEHFAIATEDVESLRNWYCNVLGLIVIRKVEKTPRRSQPVYYLECRGGGCLIEVHQSMMEEKGKKRIVLPSAGRRLHEIVKPGFTHMCFIVDDFKKIASDLKSKGVSIHGVRTTSLGWKQGFITDPDGNIIELFDRSIKR